MPMCRHPPPEASFRWSCYMVRCHAGGGTAPARNMWTRNMRERPGYSLLKAGGGG
eukprot:CAMPEP_0174359944 /NCGR_PEP_ID=MMETSP0811_2-20130205/51377_1 /TAXON_ID=73025 ORGANISM="Eutreptiella gymnastica-like, Strain CCMP1594" /NCGR_SAMPLE_ID=MMETSP0811_2 /ASSEMBLY_ACC=CAM_ASM_000667 /LENGTH=54 /DNA_ID=CAMNT_0015495123 /DNA_START=1464 /DNA_END=1624 /DNA_ORIENTATION=-